MTLLNIPYQRLNNQQIAEPTSKTPAEVVASMGAMQGQDYPGAKWSIGLRCPSSTDAEIEQAVIDKQIVRTWVNRGTLHLIATEDLRWMIDLIGPRIISTSARRYNELELDEDTLNRTNSILENALEDGNVLSRKALLAIIEEHGIPTKGQRGVYMLQRASSEGLICQGIEDRRNPMFYRIDTLSVEPKKLAREESLAELASRYFTSHGPATLQDFAWWTGLVMADIRAGFEEIKPQLVEEIVDDVSYWSVASEEASSTVPDVFALPGFDEYILGYKDRSVVLDPQFANNICPGGNGVFYPTIISNGQVVGTWKRSFKKDVMIVEISPFTSLSDLELAGFAEAVKRYSEFLGMREVIVI